MVAAALFAPSAQCERASAKPKPPAPGPAGFATVCGLVQGGETDRFRRTVEGVAPGTIGRTTTLHFPDETVTLVWRAADRASVTFAGMSTQEASVTTPACRATFTCDRKPCYWISDGAVAATELKTLP